VTCVHISRVLTTTGNYCLQCFDTVGWRQEGHVACKKYGGWWRWALVSPDGVTPSQMVAVSASVNLPLHHKVQKFSDTDSPRWCQKKGCKMVVVCWNLRGCPKLPDRSQPLVGRSSPYCEIVWRRYWCLPSFFPIIDTCLSCEDIARQSCAMVPRWRFFYEFLHPVFAASAVQQRFRPAS